MNIYIFIYTYTYHLYSLFYYINIQQTKHILCLEIKIREKKKIMNVIMLPSAS